MTAALADAANGTAVGVLTELSYGEWAAALSAADLSSSDPAADVVATALLGLARLGLDGVRGRRAESARLVEEMHHGPGRQARGRARRDHGRLWGGSKAFTRVHRLLERAWWSECPDCRGHGCAGCGRAGYVDLPTALRTG